MLPPLPSKAAQAMIEGKQTVTMHIGNAIENYKAPAVVAGSAAQFLLDD